MNLKKGSFDLAAFVVIEPVDKCNTAILQDFKLTAVNSIKQRADWVKSPR